MYHDVVAKVVQLQGRGEGAPGGDHTHSKSVRAAKPLDYCAYLKCDCVKVFIGDNEREIACGKRDRRCDAQNTCTANTPLPFAGFKTDNSTRTRKAACQ